MEKLDLKLFHDEDIAYEIISDLEPSDSKIEKEYLDSGLAEIENGLDRFYTDKENKIYVKVVIRGKAIHLNQGWGDSPDEFEMDEDYYPLEDEAGLLLTIEEVAKQVDRILDEELRNDVLAMNNRDKI